VIDGEKYSIRFQVVPRTGVDDGIESAREILPLCVFDESKCEKGISYLENYRKDWDENRGCWKDKPFHDETSHGADAFRYFAVAKTKRVRTATTQNLRI
jgi:phage terminase large subunit